MSEKSLKERLNSIRDLTTTKGVTLKEPPPCPEQTAGDKVIKIRLPENLINKLDLLRLTDEYRSKNRSELLLSLLDAKFKEDAVESALLKLTKSIK